MGENVRRNYTSKNEVQNLLQTWTNITEVLITNGYSVYLLKEFSGILSGQADQACVKGIATSTVLSIAETDRSEGLHTPTILSVISNHQTCDDASSMSLGYRGDRNVAAGSDDCQPANVYSKWMSRSNVEDEADTVTYVGAEDEINYSDIDDPSGVSPSLVADNACLSQYHSRSPAQACEDTLAAEETASQTSSRVINIFFACLAGVPVRGCFAGSLA
ncbi:hypothetical protein BKA65DRAFT_488589 [Rhexocercosporidium sp. MPI-PUGE-AT-0058]|nr:hypothetical protein BKA65DRAFT_488589 [Rhexocercosporidium sp. MPI-PUGE-AT-0058]